MVTAAGALPRFAVRCGVGDALWALLILSLVDVGAAAPTNCPVEWAGRLGEAVLTVISFFSAVSFTAAACKEIESAELFLETVRLCWEAAGGTSSEFVTLLRGCVPELPADAAVKMAAVLCRTDTAPVPAASKKPPLDAPKVGGPGGYGRALADALAVGLEEAKRDAVEMTNDKIREIADRAAKTAAEQTTTPEATQNALLEATMYPVSVLKIAKGDSVMFDKLRSKLVKEGTGEYHRHLTSVASFDDWLAVIYVWLISEQHTDAVCILQKWRLSIALEWAMGGKEYVKLYFKKYHGTFPTECDSQLMF